jgi:hypothetical protein
MQTTELGDLNDPSRPRDLPRKWALCGEPQVRPGTVVVGEIGSQRSSEMPSIQDHEMIQAISAYGTD